VRPGQDGTPYAATLDPWLYEGTAGVGLFLAELHAVTGDRTAAQTAQGAIRHALRAGSREGATGLYAGMTGVALAAARAAELLADQELADGAHRLVAVVCDAELPATADLIDGVAGVIAGLLVLADLLDDESARHRATALGDRLIATGTRGPGLSWATSDPAGGRNLTGFAHGAAGGAFALAELYGRTAEPRFAHAARDALDYERATFDERAGNWPDFRRVQGGARPMVAWCHGGPGIALSRLSALHRLGDPRWRDEAEIGLRLARSSLEHYVRYGGGGFTLCHGVAGNADILLTADRLLAGGWREPALAAARTGADRHAERANWPCGVPPRQSPGLLLGLSGVGHFYLRTACGEIPSPLLVTGLDRWTRFREDRPAEKREFI
jgi:lantibiotic modifying enzyme